MAAREGAHFIVRGVRSVRDFEYEREQADINRQLSGVETVLLFAEPQLSSLSSTMVRELQFFGKDVSKWVAKPVRNTDIQAIPTDNHNKKQV